MSNITQILNKSLIERNILPQIIKWIPEKEALILLGSRQVGKTSLLYLLIRYLAVNKGIAEKDIFYLDLERIDNLELLNAGVDRLLDYIYEQSPEPREISGSGQSPENSRKFVFIDEIQYLDNPTNILKLLVDHHSDRIKIFATGSSALTIKKKFKDSLVGRKITFEVYSLDFREYLLFKNERELKDLIDKHSPVPRFSGTGHSDFSQLKPISDISHQKLIKHYFEYALFGGYPAVAMLNEHAKKKKYLEDIYNSYIRKDINAIFSLENITAFNKIVKLLSLNIGNLINAQDISKEIGIARQTVEKYFSILESTYVCRFISPYFTNKKKEIVKMPKVYFYDIGLRNRIINDFRKIDERVDAGALIENVVFKNLLKRAETVENIKFWRLKYGSEVDFVIDEENILPLEVKLKETDNLPAGMVSFSRKYKSKTAVVANKKTLKQKNGFTFVPFYLI
ncbi:ATP-binding protein [candidate division WOR-3 bacterium]|nr:ATP-binding protein [candidate division WOR-3 bacterium]